MLYTQSLIESCADSVFFVLCSVMDYRELIITYSMILSLISVNLFERDVAGLVAAQLPISLQLTCLLEVCYYFFSVRA